MWCIYAPVVVLYRALFPEQENLPGCDVPPAEEGTGEHLVGMDMALPNLLIVWGQRGRLVLGAFGQIKVRIYGGKTLKGTPNAN